MLKYCNSECCSVAVKIFYYSWSSCFFLDFVFPPDEREAVQKKTFTKWVNSILSRVGCRISDLYLDLRDGRMLIKLLEVLSGERLVRFSLCQTLHFLFFCLLFYFMNHFFLSCADSCLYKIPFLSFSLPFCL